MMADTVACTIERRLLVNFRIEPEAVARLLPAPFRPQLVSGAAVGGICFLRLGRTRSKHVPALLGITTENVAHRFAVEWDDEAGHHLGVYVPRRDTDSLVTSLAGGRIFPGSYQLARFRIDEPGGDVRIEVRSRDRQMAIDVEASPADHLESGLFATMEEAISFFRCGSLGFSPSARPGGFDGVRLKSTSWAAQPMNVERLRSSFFSDARIFPNGACAVDSALVMRDLRVHWISEEGPSCSLYCAA